MTAVLAAPPRAPVGALRLLAGLAAADRSWSGQPATYPEHLRRWGPLPPVGTGSPDLALIGVVEQSGLLGRGGAGFPTGRKLRSVAGGRRRAVVVANGAEGEPASHKDQLLLRATPHLVLDGLLLAARAVGAQEAYLCLHTRAVGLPAVRAALAERGRLPIRVEVVEVPARYVASEGSALVNWIGGGSAVPLVTPPRLHERGVAGRPTLVQNVETLANLALIARWGADWFRSVGTPAEPGSLLLTVSGAVSMPGVLEVPTGTTIGTALELAGGDLRRTAAVLVGGYFGGWLPTAAAARTPLTHTALRAAGLGLGAGVLVALPPGACGLVETARVATYLAGQSAGQCGPCRFGLASVASALQAVATCDRQSRASAAEVRRLSPLVEGRGACKMPDGAIRLISTALQVFATEVDQHVRYGRCSHAGHRMAPVLPIPVSTSTVGEGR